MNPQHLVLLVDDIPDYLDIMEMNLPEDCHAERALSIDHAKQVLSSDPCPDLTVIDVRLSEEDPSNRDGIELLTWCKEHRPLMPVMMISAYKEFEFEAESLSLGAEAFLHKPLQPVNFRATIERLLRRTGNAHNRESNHQ